MGETLAEHLGKISGIQDIADIFERFGFRIEKKNIGRNVVKEFNFSKKKSVISNVSLLADYGGHFQIYGIAFRRGEMLKRHMKNSQQCRWNYHGAGG